MCETFTCAACAAGGATKKAEHVTLEEGLSNRKIWLAASTHVEEEQGLIL